jgi:hypothetical protein
MRQALTRRLPPTAAFGAFVGALALALAACGGAAEPTAAAHKGGKQPVTIGGPGTSPPISTTPPPPAIPKPNTSGAGGYANAKQQWVKGASAPSYEQITFFRQAASDLTGVLSAGGGDPTTYPQAIDDLYTLSTLPETDATPQQQQEAKTDIAALNTFFGTTGLYD